ncbi:MAG TPA: cupin domain-containing protein [Chloroflexota bacterium]|jgi:quercetin dioxygenase-like cupin family protein
MAAEAPYVEPFYAWQAEEGIPVHTGLLIEDLDEVELAPWERMGGRGAFINMGTKPGSNTSAYVCEIPGGGSLKPQAHMFDQFIYIVSGRGATTIWNPGQEKHLVEWKDGSFLAIPMNAHHQHFNGGTEPARFLSYHDGPTIMNIFRNDRFMFDNPFVFSERLGGEDYYSGEGILHPVPGKSIKVWETNFVPDTRSIQLYEWKERGANSLNVMLDMATSRLHTHISQFPVGTYKKSHVDIRSRGSDPGGGSLLLILEGVGFTLEWQPGDKEFRKLNWKRNSLVIAAAGWYHGHFNAGATPARYLALVGGTGGNRRANTSDVSERDGGGQIEYEDENPEIHRLFEADLASHGAVCRMGDLSPFCTTGVSLEPAAV